MEELRALCVDGTPVAKIDVALDERRDTVVEGERVSTLEVADLALNVDARLAGVLTSGVPAEKARWVRERFDSSLFDGLVAGANAGTEDEREGSSTGERLAAEDEGLEHNRLRLMCDPLTGLVDAASEMEEDDDVDKGGSIAREVGGEEAGCGERERIGEEDMATNFVMLTELLVEIEDPMRPF